MLFVLVTEFIYTLVLLCKLAERIKGNPQLGKFCFNVKPNIHDLLLYFISCWLYLILIAVVLAMPVGLREENCMKLLLILIPVCWLAYLFLPVSVYEHGCKYFDGCVTEHEISYVERCEQKTYKVYIANGISTSRFVKSITIKITSGHAVPAFLTKEYFGVTG
ncbi:MAG: hypothetical protein IKD92_01365 [Lachnospiraceae bacterium]|nr:hypothetical protein [Lachnospiraceae bacterium]